MKTMQYRYSKPLTLAISVVFYSISAIMVISFLMGCSNQNDYLSKGKELIKSDKRRKEERAVKEFYLAIRSEPTSPEANYLLGYYNSSQLYLINRQVVWEEWLNANKLDKSFEQLKQQSGPEGRGIFLFKAYQENPSKYLEILVFETLRTSSDELQKATQSALVQVYQKGNKDKLVALLRKAMKSKDNRDRHDAQLVFSTIAKYNSKYTVQVVEELKSLLKYNRMETRLNAVKALGEIGSREAISELVAIVNARQPVWNWQQIFNFGDTRYQEQAEIRQLAVAALGQIGTENPSTVAIDRLIDIVKNKGSALRVDAIEALSKTGNTKAVKPLIKVLQEDVKRQIAVNL